MSSDPTAAPVDAVNPAVPEPAVTAAEIADQRQAWPVLGRHDLAPGPLFSWVADDIETPDGSTITRSYVDHPGAVAVIALDEATGRIVLVRQYRHPVGHRLVEPPAGLLDVADEAAVVAARRELAEEVGLQAADWRVLVDLFTTPGVCSERLRIFLARGLTDADRPEDYQAHGEEAHLDIVWADLDEVGAAILAGRVGNPALCTGVLAALAARDAGYDRLRPADAAWPARDGD